MSAVRDEAIAARRSGRQRKAVKSYVDEWHQDSYAPPSAPSSKKRKRTSHVAATPAEAPSGAVKVQSAGTETSSTVAYNGLPAAKVTPKKGSSVKEKRLKRYRDHVPKGHELIMFRAITQRMFMLNRTRQLNPDCPHGTEDCPMESVDIAGTTGNVYTVTISHVPTCTCPNFRISNNPQCKHILYVLIKVLKAPEHLQYQLAFLTSELRAIFDAAPPMAAETAAATDMDGKRKAIEGDCPICMDEVEADGAEQLVYCQAACGNNLHKTCFDRWAATKGGGANVTCPYCRAPWHYAVNEQALRNISKTGAKNRDGYVNVAGQLGLSGRRDYSTYNDAWVRQQRRHGYIDDDEDEDYRE